MFPYLLIIPERFNYSLARAVDGTAEALGWYIKAARLAQGSKIKCIFVSTNSICQDEQLMDSSKL